MLTYSRVSLTNWLLPTWIDQIEVRKCLTGPFRCAQEVMSREWHSTDIIIIDEGGRATLRAPVRLYNLSHKYFAERCKWQENAIRPCAVTTFPLWFTTIECNCLAGKLRGICGPNSSISAQIFTPIAASIGTLWAQQWGKGWPRVSYKAQCNHLRRLQKFGTDTGDQIRRRLVLSDRS